MITLEIQPQDSLFFRDGRPFNQGESQFAPSLFPPSPQTLVGALRAHWAAKLGWPGRGPWNSKVIAELGSGDDLNGIKFKGPLLLRDGEPLFPAPALLMGKIEKTADNILVSELGHLKPSAEPYHCDLGENVHLPEPEKKDGIEGRKLLEDWWITQSGFEKVLNGELPSAEMLIHPNELWRKEPRVGITLNPDTCTTELSALYATSHIRLNDKKDKAVSLAMMVENPPFQDANTMVSVGGEGRGAWLSIGDPISAPAPVIESTRYTAIVLTPLLPSQGPPKHNDPFETLPGKLISACLPRPQRWGGWDTEAREPLALRPHLAPGSVLFMDAKEDGMASLTTRDWRSIGQRTEWGFGLVAIGTWMQKLLGYLPKRLYTLALAERRASLIYP